MVDGEVKKNSYNGFLNADWHGHLTRSGYNDQISELWYDYGAIIHVHNVKSLLTTFEECDKQRK